MKHDDNDHWWLAENGKGQVGYVPAACLMINIDETLPEEDSDTNRKDGQGKGTDGTKIGGEMGQDGERRKTYSASVINGFKRISTIYVGDSIVMMTDTRLSKGTFTGSKNIACDREGSEGYGKGKWRVHTGTHRDEQHRQGRNNSNSGEVQEPNEEDEESKGGTDHLIRNFYQCLVTGTTDTGIRSGWQSRGW